MVAAPLLLLRLPALPLLGLALLGVVKSGNSEGHHVHTS